MIVRDLLTVALHRANDTASGHTPNGRDLEHARILFNGRLKKYSSDNLISVYQKVLDFKAEKTEILIGNQFEGKDIYQGEGDEREYLGHTEIKAVKTEKDIPIKIGEARSLFDIFYCEKPERISDEELYSNFFMLWPGEEGTKITTTIYNDTNLSVTLTEADQFIYQGVVFKLGSSVTIAANSNVSNKELQSVTTIEDISVNDILYESEFSNQVYAKVNSVDFIGGKNLPIRIEKGLEDIYVGSQPDIYVSDINKIIAMNYQDQMGRWRNMNFRNLQNFFVDIDVDIYNARPYSKGLISVQVKDWMIGKKLKAIYNGNMDFAIDDFIDLPPEYEEFLTVALIVELLRDDESADPTHLAEAKEELRSMTESLMENNVSTKMIQRDESEFYDDYDDSISRLKSGKFLKLR